MWGIGHKPLQALYDVVKDVVTVIEGNTDQGTGLPIGLPDFDKITGGLRPGDLNVVAARPAMGKTALALTLTFNVASQSHLPVLYFSLETSNNIIGIRMMSAVSRVKLQKLKTRALEVDDWTKLSNQLIKINCAETIYLCDAGSLSSQHINDYLQELASIKIKPGMVVIDYLQLMSSDTSQPCRAWEMIEITRKLKILAREWDIPFLVISQLPEYADMLCKRPLLKDLPAEWGIEQFADLIAFIYRPDCYDREKGPCETEMIIAKYRHGAVRAFSLGFLPEYSCYNNIFIGNQ